MITPTCSLRSRLIVPLLLTAGGCMPALALPPGVEVVAQTGTPTGNGTISSFSGSPCISGTGQLVWAAWTTGSTLGDRNDFAQFRGAPGSITEISREGAPLPDGNGIMSAPHMPSINSAGVLAGDSFFAGTAQGADDDSGIVMGSGGALVHVARQGGPMPDGNGTIFDIASVHMDESGAVTFYAYSLDSIPSFVNGIYRGSGGPVSTLIRSGQPAPGGVGVYDNIAPDLDINPSGAVAFRAELTGAGDNLHDGRVYLFNGVTTSTIAREGDLSPDGNGQLWDDFQFIRVARVSNNNKVAFRSDLLGTNGGASDNEAIFRGSGGPLTLIARKGQPAPDGNGTISRVYIPDISDSGAAVFSVDLAGTSGGTADDKALLSGSGGALTTILREGQPTPSGDGTIKDGGFTNWAVNAGGEMCIHTELANTQAGGNYENALYFYRPGQPLLEIARNGTPMLGSTVTLITSTFTIDLPEQTSINDAGQCSFRVYLADGREAVVRFTPPPACPGDFNHDGVINTNDLVLLLAKFGQNVAPYSVGEMNGDTIVDTNDLVQFLALFGRQCR